MFKNEIKATPKQNKMKGYRVMEKEVLAKQTIELEDLEIEAEGSVLFGPNVQGPRRDIGPRT